MSDDRALLADRLRAAAEAAGAVADPACREALLRPLLAASQLVEAPIPPAPQLVAARVSEAVQVSLIGLVRGLVSPAGVELCAAALNACFAYAGAASRVEAAATKRLAEPLLVAARSIPALRPLGMAPPVDVATSADPEADDDDNDNDDDRDEAPANDAAVDLAEDDEQPRENAPVNVLTPDLRLPFELPPPVRLDPEAGPPAPPSAFRAAIVDEAADALAMLARHRAERPMRERPEAESRMLTLADAVVATGPSCVAHLRAFWKQAIKAPDPFRAWAPAFVLASLDGAAGLRAVAEEILRLAPGDHLRGRAIAEALAVAPHPAILALAEDLSMSPHPVARAVGVDVLARRSSLSPEALRFALIDANVPVLLAAIRAGLLLRPLPKWLLGFVLQWTHHPDPDVAWEATRAAAILGRPEPWIEVLSGGSLLGVLGARAAELFVLFGEAQHVTRLERLLEGHPLSRSMLSCVARFGHPGSWAFLVHCLGDEDFAADALDALVTLFGPRVEGRDALKGPAWRDAITAARFEGLVRLRRGAPWSPGVVATEIASGELSRRDAELRADELAVRLGLLASASLDGWPPGRDAELTAYLALAESKGRDFPPGSWESRSLAAARARR